MSLGLRYVLDFRILAPVIVALVVAGTARASVEISSSPTVNMSCTGGVCSPTAQQANLNTTDLANMLQASDVKVVTGAGAISITFTSSFTWASANRLTLDANFNVSFKAPMVVAGTGGVTIVTSDGGTGGDLIFFTGGYIDFWDVTSSLIINGNAYTLVDSLKTLKSAIAVHQGGRYALSRKYNAFKDKISTDSPIKQFSGTFEGLGHEISNLAIKYSFTGKHPTPVGLFSISSGVIRDIGLTEVNVTSNYAAAGLVGENDGTIIRSYTSGPVSAANYYVAGGLASWNYGTIIQCSSSSTVTGNEAGGLVGESIGGTITGSFTTGAVSAGLAGGLVGLNRNSFDGLSTGTITQSFSTGKVSTGKGGGLVGENDGAISLSHSESEIDGYGTVGGLVGVNVGTISQSYADGTMSGGQGGGGLVGANGGTILNSYATGAASAGYYGGLVGVNGNIISQSYSTGASSGGGLIGNSQPSEQLNATYWDTDTSGVTDLSKGSGNIPYDAGITGVTSSQLKQKLPKGFDPAIWGEKKRINGGFPYLLANPPT